MFFFLISGGATARLPPPCCGPAHCNQIVLKASERKYSWVGSCPLKRVYANMSTRIENCTRAKNCFCFKQLCIIQQRWWLPNFRHTTCPSRCTRAQKQHFVIKRSNINKEIKLRTWKDERYESPCSANKLLVRPANRGEPGNCTPEFFKNTFSC